MPRGCVPLSRVLVTAPLLLAIPKIAPPPPLGVSEKDSFIVAAYHQGLRLHQGRANQHIGHCFAPNWPT